MSVRDFGDGTFSRDDLMFDKERDSDMEFPGIELLAALSVQTGSGLG
jgi:hypothetical protein